MTSMHKCALIYMLPINSLRWREARQLIFGFLAYLECQVTHLPLRIDTGT
jgi:hypothetical protein